MTLEDIIDMEIKYISLFSRKKKRASGIILYDDKQKDKYAHNLMFLNQQVIEISELKQYEKTQSKQGFVKFRLEHQDRLDFQFLSSYQMSTFGYFSSHINHLHLNANKDADIKIIDPSADDLFFEFMYEEDLPFGVSYAEGNVQRQKEILKAHQKDYFYLGLKYQDTYIGHLNVHIQNDRAKIDEFYVKEDYQKQGYGTALMSFMIETLKRKKIEEVYLVTDLADTAKELYVKYGFKLTGTFKEYQKHFDNAK